MNQGQNGGTWTQKDAHVPHHLQRGPLHQPEVGQRHVGGEGVHVAVLVVQLLHIHALCLGRVDEGIMFPSIWCLKHLSP